MPGRCAYTPVEFRTWPYSSRLRANSARTSAGASDSDTARMRLTDRGNLLAYRTQGQRDQDLMARIADLGVPLLGSVPRMPEPVGDLDGLLEVAELLAG